MFGKSERGLGLLLVPQNNKLVTAKARDEVRPGARIKGDLSSPLIAVAEGALVQGNVAPDSMISRFTERRVH